MTIYFAADHAGFSLKGVLLPYVRDVLGYTVVDGGSFSNDEEDDYPAIIRVAGKAVSKDPTHTRAIIIGGSGQGEAIVANRFPGVRAVVYYGGNNEIIRLSREHNDANILSLGARFLSEDEAVVAVTLWLEVAFSREARHVRRINTIDNYD